jgi:hypothetical protein
MKSHFDHPDSGRRSKSAIAGVYIGALLLLVLPSAAPGADAPPKPAKANRTTAESLPNPDGVQYSPRPAFSLAFMANAAGTGNIIRIDLPETAGTVDRRVSFAPVLGMPPVHWKSDGAGGWTHETETPALKAVGKLHFEDDTVVMSLAITNRMDKPLKDFGAAICLQLASAPLFRDLTRQRVFFFADGKPVSFHEMEKRDGYTSLRALTKTGAKREEPGPHPGMFANISRIIADDGVVCITSPDGEWTLGTLWENARHVFNNPGATLACIHSDPIFPEIAPAETQTARGWMVILKGTPQEVHANLLARLNPHCASQ